VSPASKLPDAPGYRLHHARPSGSVLRPKPRNPPPMVLWPNHQTPRTRPGLTTPSVEPAKPFTSGTRTVYSDLPRSLTWPPPMHRSMSTTSSCSSCTMRLALDPVGHRVPRTMPTCLSTPRRPRKAKTFRACSSPTPTQTKPQPTPAILGQESDHTTLSTTPHECIDNTPHKQ
jgi:hypothetical protein